MLLSLSGGDGEAARLSGGGHSVLSRCPAEGCLVLYEEPPAGPHSEWWATLVGHKEKFALAACLLRWSVALIRAIGEPLRYI